MPTSPVSEKVHASTDLSIVKDADIILAAVPTMALEEVLTKTVKYIDHPVIIINVAKGFHPVTHERLSVVIEHIVPADKRTAVVSLIGPSHAEEVAFGIPTTVLTTSHDMKYAEEVQDLFKTENGGFDDKKFSDFYDSSLRTYNTFVQNTGLLQMVFLILIINSSELICFKTTSVGNIGKKN